MTKTDLLVDAASRGDLAAAMNRLAAGHDPNAARADGRSALMSAVIAGQPAIVAALLDAGADVNARARDGSTALLEATRLGSPEIVALLVGRGACVVVTDRLGQTPRSLAEAHGQVAILRLLAAACDEEEPARVRGAPSACRASERAKTSRTHAFEEDLHDECRTSARDKKNI